MLVKYVVTCVRHCQVKSVDALERNHLPSSRLLLYSGALFKRCVVLDGLKSHWFLEPGMSIAASGDPISIIAHANIVHRIPAPTAHMRSHGLVFSGRNSVDFCHSLRKIFRGNSSQFSHVFEVGRLQWMSRRVSSRFAPRLYQQ